MLRIWGRRNSANVQKVMWLVGELGLAHEDVPAGGDFGGLETPVFRAMNPFGRVPVIADGETVVWESHAILRYLAARHGGPALWGEPAARARAEPWMDWVQTAFQPDFLGGVFWGYYRTPPERRDGPAIARAWARCAAHLATVEAVLADRPFLAGEAFSLADIPLGAMLYRYFELDLERPDLPAVRRWYETLCARPAYRAHVMLPFDELRGRLAF
jgi:glutathione S-transferase